MDEKNRREENEKYVVDNFNVDSFFSENNADDMLSKRLGESVKLINKNNYNQSPGMFNQGTMDNQSLGMLNQSVNDNQSLGMLNQSVNGNQSLGMLNQSVNGNQSSRMSNQGAKDKVSPGISYQGANGNQLSNMSIKNNHLSGISNMGISDNQSSHMVHEGVRGNNISQMVNFGIRDNKSEGMVSPDVRSNEALKMTNLNERDNNVSNMINLDEKSSNELGMLHPSIKGDDFFEEINANIKNNIMDENISEGYNINDSFIDEMDDAVSIGDINGMDSHDIKNFTRNYYINNIDNNIDNNTDSDLHCTQYIDYTKVIPKRTHNAAMSIITTCVIVLFATMILYIGYFQVFQKDEVINNTYNKRSSILEKSIQRGNIYSNDNQILAQTITNEEGTKRYYPFGELFAHVVGRFDNGKSGLESKYDFEMLTTKQNEIEIMLNELKDIKSQGNSIKTSLNVNIQKVAYQALNGKRGAVVAINPKNGEIMAMVSTPSYNPNDVAKNWEEYTKDKDGKHILLNRASQGLYAPGSTFKIITALEYMRQNSTSYNNYNYECSGELTIGDHTLHCYGNKVHGNQDMLESFANSCNTSFANIGLSLNVKKFRLTCESLLFNSKLPFEFEHSKGNFNLTKDSSEFMIAQSSFGQGEVLMTPLHLALVVSAIANDGVLMTPHIVSEILDDENNVIKKIEAEEYKRLMTNEESTYLTNLMKEVVKSGTANSLKNMSFEVAGKTGTAEYNKGTNSHAWFTCMAPVDNPEIVLSIIVEDGGTGATAAVPIARKILEQYK